MLRPRQKRRDDLHIGRLPLFRQGGATVSLMTRLSARGIRESSYLKGGCGSDKGNVSQAGRFR